MSYRRELSGGEQVELGNRPVGDLNAHPQFIEKIVQEAVRQLDAKRVILFGSRARGDAEQRSDYDIAIEAPDVSDRQWSRFVLDIEEGLDTLLAIDLVRLEEAGSRLCEEIEREGKVIYAR